MLLDYLFRIDSFTLVMRESPHTLNVCVKKILFFFILEVMRISPDFVFNCNLSEIKASIDIGHQLSSSAIDWLESQRFFALLAQYYLLRFKSTGDVFQLALASSAYRKEACPQLALKITSELWKVKGLPSACAAAWTSRGAAFNDIDNLSLAEDCAKRAINLAPDTHHAYRLLASVYKKRGLFSEAHRYFAQANQIERLRFL